MRAIVVPIAKRDDIRWALLTLIAQLSTRPRPLRGEALAEIPNKYDSRDPHRNQAFVKGDVKQPLPERVSGDGTEVAFILETEDGTPYRIGGGSKPVSAHRLDGAIVAVNHFVDGKQARLFITIPPAVELGEEWFAKPSAVVQRGLWVVGAVATAAMAAAAAAWFWMM